MLSLSQCPELAGRFRAGRIREEVSMRRLLLFLCVCFLLAAPLPAQIGKNILLSAGSPEDKALAKINATTDAAEKLALLEQWLAEFGKSDLPILAYEIYIAHYAAEKNYDKAFEYGDKLFALDPDSLMTAVNLFRISQEKGDLQRLAGYGERAAAILQRYKAKPAPEGTPADFWERQKAETLAGLADTINYLQYTMFNSGYQAHDPATRAAVLERFAIAYPDSPYASAAQQLVAAAYQQAQNYAKMLEFAQRILAADPNSVSMLILLSDYWSEKGEQLDKAEEYAKKVLDVLAAAQKPAQLTDELWQQQKSLQQGLAQSALGQVHIQKNRLQQAVEAFKVASPLLKSDPTTYGRNLYRLGFTLARMKNTTEARTVLTEAASVNSPYKALAEEILVKLGPAPGKKAAAKKRP